MSFLFSNRLYKVPEAPAYVTKGVDGRSITRSHKVKRTQ